MKFSHKTPLLFLVILLITSFISCKNTRNTNQENTKLNITATFYPLYIMLENITEGVENVKINLLAPADTGCLHDYQLTTKDMNIIEKSDILVANGAGMEDFLEKAIKSKQDHIIIASEGYPLYEENAHIWVSPEGAIYETEMICEKLCILDEKNAEAYRKNTAEYTSKLKEIQEKMALSLSSYKGRNIITFHEAFPYFAKEFSLVVKATIEREPGTSPSAKELQQIVELVKSTNESSNKCVLFAEPQYSSLAAAVISKETGCKVWELDPAVTGKIDKNAWIEAMEKNLSTLEKALGER